MASIPLGTTSGNWKTGGGYAGSLGQSTTGARVQVTSVPQQTARVQQTAPASYYQPAANPNAVSDDLATGTVGNINTYGGGGGGGYDPYAAQRAAQAQAEAEAARRAAEEEARRGELRGSISGLIDQAMSVYDTLYGNARAAAQSQRGILEQRYNKETKSLSDQFSAELPKVGAGYAARGLADSTYRTGAEHEAGEKFKGQIEDIGLQRKADEAKIGQALMEQEAQFGTGKSLLDLTRGQIGQVTDLNELTSIQNEVNRKIAELRGSAAGLQSQEAYAKRFSEVAPATDRLANLQATLSNIIEGQAPAALKKAVAQQIIGSAGLPEDQQQQLNAQITQQIG